jgi:hypothetical protein
MMPALRLLAFATLLCGCSPTAETPAPKPIATTAPATAPTPDKSAQIAPFLGHWRQSAVVIAPWWNGKGDRPEADPEFAEKDTVLMATSSSGPGIVHCEEAVYSPTSLPLDSLFEGNLKDPAKDAAKLGITGSDIPTMLQGCKSSTGDLELLFHLTEPDTLMLGLNNMIYTLKRVPPPPGGWPVEPDAGRKD